MAANTDLLKQILSEANLEYAYKRVAQKGSAGGIDNVSIEQFGSKLQHHLDKLQQDVMQRRYQPEPVRQVMIDKPGKPGEQRALGLPTVRDKVLQMAVLNIVTPLAENKFCDTSYGYRYGKGAQKAIKRVRHNIVNQKFTWIVKADIDNFFDTLDHDILIKCWSDLVEGEPILVELVTMWCRMGLVTKSNRWCTVHTGVRQGQVLAPLLANLYLHQMDLWLQQQGLESVRYADDFIIHANSYDSAHNILTMLITYLRQHLKLQLNNDPQAITDTDSGFDFLGFHIKTNSLSLPDATLRKMENKLKQWQKNQKNTTVLQSLDTLKDKLAGWKIYYGRVLDSSQMQIIDQIAQEQFVHLLRRNIRAGNWLKNPPYGVHFPLLTQENDNPRKCLRRLWKEANQSASGNLEQKINNQRRHYQKRQQLQSELHVITPGSFIAKREGRIVVRYKQKIVAQALQTQLENITISGNGISISSDVLSVCAKKNIMVHLLDSKGDPAAELVSVTAAQPASSIIQLQHHNQHTGQNIGTALILAKTKNSMNLIKSYSKNQPSISKFNKEYNQRKESMNNLIAKICLLAPEDSEHADKHRQRLMGLEGVFAAHYWAIMALLLPEHIPFLAREHKGAQDLVNSMLNYSYAILYNRIYRSVVKAGLHPQISFLHSIQNGKPTLVFDLIEPFRAQVADRTVFTLCRKSKDLQISANGLLSSETKKKLAQAILKRLGSEVRSGRDHTVLNELIINQTKQLKSTLETSSPFKPWLATW